MATPAARSLQAHAPEKGVFPLDHFGECSAAQRAYMACVAGAESEVQPCRHLSKAYLECRMARGLMVEDDLTKLGFREGEPPAASPRPVTARAEARAEERAGFVAGLRPLRTQASGKK